MYLCIIHHIFSWFNYFTVYVSKILMVLDEFHNLMCYNYTLDTYCKLFWLVLFLKIFGKILYRFSSSHMCVSYYFSLWWFYLFGWLDLVKKLISNKKLIISYKWKQLKMNTMFIDYALKNYLKINILLWKLLQSNILKIILEYVWFFIILMLQIKSWKKYLPNKIELWEKHKIKNKIIF